MSEYDVAPRSIAGPQPGHPLRGTIRDHAPIAVLVILVGWLSWVHWPAEQVIALLLILLPPASGTGARP